MKKKRIFSKSILLTGSIIIIMLFLLPNISFAQAQDDDYYQKSVDFMQGKGVLEDWFTQSFLPLYDTFMLAEYGSLILLGQAIAGIAAMLYLGNIGWSMLSGDREWEIMPMLKPFAIGLVLMNWLLFVEAIRTPIKSLTAYAEGSFHEANAELAHLKMERYKKQTQVIDIIFEEGAKAQAEIEQQNAGNKSLLEEGADAIGDGFTSLMSPVYELGARLQIAFSLALSTMLETIGLWILRVCVYLIFFLQLIFSTILIIVGPISVGMSLFPWFESSFSNWVSKFINVNLYGFMAFIVMKVGTLLQNFAFQAEIDRYDQMINSDGTVKNMSLILTFSGSGIMSFGLVVVCLIISGIGVLSVPTMANFVISTGSNAGAMSKMKKAGGSIASAGAKGISMFTGGKK